MEMQAVIQDLEQHIAKRPNRAFLRVGYDEKDYVAGMVDETTLRQFENLLNQNGITEIFLIIHSVIANSKIVDELTKLIHQRKKNYGTYFYAVVPEVCHAGPVRLLKVCHDVNSFPKAIFSIGYPTIALGGPEQAFVYSEKDLAIFAESIKSKHSQFLNNHYSYLDGSVSYLHNLMLEETELSAQTALELKLVTAICTLEEFQLYYQ